MSASPPLPYRLIATDLDGTLLRSDHVVSERTAAALRDAARAGAAHIVVTGRPASRCRDILAGFGYQGLAVCAEGAQVFDAGGQRILTSITLDRALAAVALAKIEQETGPLAIGFVRDGLDGDFLVEPGFRLGRAQSVTVTHDRDELAAEPLCKVFIQHPELADDDLAAIAAAAVGDLVGVVVSGKRLVELHPYGVTKATGLTLAARRLGVAGASTIAFGDMPNDLPMFRWAGHGVAMANAHEELKAVAHEVTASNDEDGIALVLERLLAG